MRTQTEDAVVYAIGTPEGTSRVLQEYGTLLFSSLRELSPTALRERLLAHGIATA